MFTQTVAVERGMCDVHLVAETVLSTKINGMMQINAAFTAGNDTNVPVDKKNTDTQTSVNVGVFPFTRTPH